MKTSHKIIYYLLLCFIILNNLLSCKITEKKKQKYMATFYREIKDSFPGTTIRKSNDSVFVILPSKLLFDLGKSDLKDSADIPMKRMANFLIKYNKTQLLITGHTDNRGEDEFNEKLSKERANNTKLKLTEFKVTTKRILTWGMGSRNPITPNDTEENQSKNRRVDMVILYEENE